MHPRSPSSRRDLLCWALSALGASVTRRADGKEKTTPPFDEGFERHELSPVGPSGARWPVNVYVPRRDRPTPLPGVVLLHGLGETHDPALGVVAWPKLYGALGALRRLHDGKVSPLFPRAGYLRAERAAEINARLAKMPLRDVALICPATPNPNKPGPASKTLDTYAAWLADALVPALRAELPHRVQASRLALGGCSLGGYVAIEVLLRRPEPFRAVTLVQNAIGSHRAGKYAAGLREIVDQRRAQGATFAVQLVSSTSDPYLTPTRALSRALDAQAVRHELRVPPGPHDQPWLQEVGCIDALLFCEQALYGTPAAATPRGAPRTHPKTH